MYSTTPITRGQKSGETNVTKPGEKPPSLARAHERTRAHGLSSCPYLHKTPKITRIKVYANAVAEVVREGPKSKPPDPGPRGKVRFLSRKSRNRMLVKALACGVRWRSMLVLTYGNTYPGSGKVVKKHLGAALQRLRRLRNFTTYFWWLEFQQRGAPHVHILVNWEPKPGDRAKIAQTWVKSLSGLPGSSGEELERVFRVHNHREAWQVEQKPGGLANDVALYATKTRQKLVPEDFQDVGRWWGCTRDLQPLIVAEFPMTDESTKIMLDATEHRCSTWDIIPKYIFGLEYAEEVG